MMRYSLILEVFVQALIFATPVRLNTLDFYIEKAFNMCLETKKNLLNFRFGKQQIDPSEFAKSINKGDIIFVATNRDSCWPPHIGINEF